ncbi:RNA polymerase sigma factor [Xanthovirga aplysinae]|uniref:RNA polymerase sigma factor n=1 Tax=Xanthovirga aplysinae TaxID=2529853 RepID=UPI0012BC4052|nr:sigma-70 family RNA polymerase sigma factor [Xanthovirga aplysinae]MTI32702.1 sigma-70 family RNA polymerase sigma factor [Xanthovirga aplysinae]
MTKEEFLEEILPLKNKLFRFAKSLLGSPMEAEDVIQDVFVKLWMRKTKLGEYKNLDAFAMTIAKNLCFDHLKYKGRNMEGLEKIDHGMDLLTPYKETETGDTMNVIQKIIQGLPEQQRLILHLKDIEGQSFKEIEIITGLNINTLRVNLSRARKKVREELNKIHGYGIESC